MKNFSLFKKYKSLPGYTGSSCSGSFYEIQV